MKRRENIWKFVEVLSYMHIEVCKTFICNVLQVGKQIIDTLQNKITLGKSLADQRGKHFNRPLKINENVWKMLKSFVENIPKSNSHYYYNKGRFYFENPGLDLKILYQKFTDFYLQETSKYLELSLTSFRDYFNDNINIGFGNLPQIFVIFITESKN